MSGCIGYFVGSGFTPGGIESQTLHDISLLSTTTPKSLYSMTSGVDVKFETSNNDTLLYLDEANEMIGIGTETPTSRLDIIGRSLTDTVLNVVSPISHTGDVFNVENGIGYELLNVDYRGNVQINAGENLQEHKFRVKNVWGGVGLQTAWIEVWGENQNGYRGCTRTGTPLFNMGFDSNAGASGWGYGGTNKAVMVNSGQNIYLGSTSDKKFFAQQTISSSNANKRSQVITRRFSSTVDLSQWMNESDVVIAKINATGEGTFSGVTDNSLTASLGVYTDVNKKLTSIVPTSGILGHWDRTGSVLSPSNSGDDIVTTGDIEAENESLSGTLEMTASSIIIGDISGNARGSSSIDFQSSRTAVTQVASGSQTEAFGAGNTVSGMLSTAVGKENEVTGVACFAFGYLNKATTQINTVVGALNEASGGSSSALGYLNIVSGTEAMGAGSGNNVTGTWACGFGRSNTVNGSGSGGFGNRGDITGFLSYTFGYDNTVVGNYSVAIGSLSSITVSDSITIGKSLTNNVTGSVDIGSTDLTKMTVFADGEVKVRGDIRGDARMIRSKSVYTGTDTTDNVYAHICNSSTSFTLTVTDGTDDGEEIKISNTGIGLVILSGKISMVTALNTLYQGETIVLLWSSTNDEWQ